MAKVELKFNFTNIEEASAELERLQSQILNRNLNVTMNQSNGNFSDSIVNLSLQLKKVGDSFAKIVEQTSVALINSGDIAKQGENIAKKIISNIK